MPSSIKVSGPFFSRRDSVVKFILDEMRHDVADKGLEFVQESTSVFKYNHPDYLTGKRQPGTYFNGLNVAVRTGEDAVNDSGIVYGWWLEKGREGTSFSGYQLWFKSYTKTNAIAGNIAKQTLSKNIGKLNH